jgi:hypothetical protein
MTAAKQRIHRIIMNLPVAFGLLIPGVLPIADSGSVRNHSPAKAAQRRPRRADDHPDAVRTGREIACIS